MYKIRKEFLLNSFVSTRIKMYKNKSSSPSHYETLEVNPRATQSEIKAAYFKLSKQYHPDKNASVEAIDKFRTISTAYEILGNYASRKSYDRSIITKTSYHHRQQASINKDLKAKFYQSQVALSRDAMKSGSTPIYDFDAWTKAHYGRTLNRTFREKMESSVKRQMKVDEEAGTIQGFAQNLSVTVAMMIFLSGIVALIVCTSAYDDTSLTILQKQQFEESRLLNEKSQQADATDKSVSSN